MNDRENRDFPIELYNLNEDITEENEVLYQHPEVIKEMNKLFYEAQSSSELFP